MLNDFVNKNEIELFFEQKTKNLFANYVLEQDLKENSNIMNKKINEMSKNYQKKSANFVSFKDLQEFSSKVETNFGQIHTILEEKANKKSVAKAIHRKLNKNEVEEMLTKKADLVINYLK